MCVKDEAERSAAGWGEVSPVSQSGCVAVEERESRADRVKSVRRVEEEDICFFSLPA